MLTVQQTAKLTRVSVRTLHYYDQIGLLKPARVRSSRYRIYGSDEVNRLQQILLYREMDMALSDIRQKTSGSFDSCIFTFIRKSILPARLRRL